MSRLRSYMAEAPCTAMDKLLEKFLSEYDALIVGSGCVQWDESADAARQLIGWALAHKVKDGLVPLIDKDDATALDILCVNAEKLASRKEKQEQADRGEE